MNRRGVYDLKHSTDFGNQAPILFDRFSGTDRDRSNAKNAGFFGDILRPLRPIGRSKDREAFAWVLGVLADRGMLKGQRIAIDATTLEANAAMRFDCAAGLGREPTREDLARLDRKRKKRMSNREWKSGG